MAQKSALDPLRALAIGSQALGFIVIFLLGTLLESPRAWQGLTLAAMLVAALSVALTRRYRRNQRQRERDALDQRLEE